MRCANILFITGVVTFAHVKERVRLPVPVLYGQCGSRNSTQQMRCEFDRRLSGYGANGSEDGWGSGGKSSFGGGAKLALASLLAALEIPWPI